MARMATRIASGMAAAGIATLMSMTPAQAQVAVPPGDSCVGAGCTYTPPGSGDSGETPWLRIALGAAGGVALVGAGAATVSSRSRRQHAQPHPA
jgi:hypothetical protein